jgi:hypothetical protein
MRPIQTNELSQHAGSAPVGLRPRGRVSVPIAGSPHRVDRIYLITRSDQRMQIRHSCDTFRKTTPRQPPAGLVHHLHIMVIFSTVIPHEQHQRSLPPSVSLEEDHSDLTGRGTV